jgi:methionyl-tRNA synthetase
LLNPRSALSSAIPEKRKTKHWYFPLDKYEQWLKEWIVDGKKDEWKPNVYGQCKSWLDSGLQPRAMTRDSNWGVPVPLPGAEGKVLYVWFDAPIGYISATKELTNQWSDYWCKEDTKLVHFIGKDNIVFHCIIFPAMLKAHGGFVLPDNVPANEFLNLEGQKISTSRNWAVWVDEYLKDFPGQQDALRYVLCANAPETKDNDFTWKDFQNRVNNELSAILGNFENRVFVMMHKLCKGRVPPADPAFINDMDKALIADIGNAKVKVQNALENYKFRDGLSEVIDLARKGNKYLQDNAPWSLSKTPEQQAENQKRIDVCIHICLQLTANLAILLNPFLPATANKMCKKMKVVERMLDWENAGRMDLLKTNYPLREPELLFRKIEDTEVAAQVDKLKVNLVNNTAAKMEQKPESKPIESAPAAQGPQAAQTEKPQITIDEFARMDLRVGTILRAEKVEKADKLLRLELDMGNEVRTVVSGIALHFKPEEIIGRQVTVVANLAPRKMRGIESKGMILMAQNGDGKLIFVSPLETADNGSEVR